MFNRNVVMAICHVEISIYLFWGKHKKKTWNLCSFNNSTCIRNAYKIVNLLSGDKQHITISRIKQNNLILIIMFNKRLYFSNRNYYIEQVSRTVCQSRSGSP